MLKLSGYDIEEFATLDGGILEKSREIEYLTDIRVVNLDFIIKNTELSGSTLIFPQLYSFPSTSRKARERRAQRL